MIKTKYTIFDVKKKMEDIYFFEVNTKYISSNVMKISVNSRVRSASEISDIFNTWDEIILVFTEKKKFFFLFFPLEELTENKPYQN